MRQMGITALRKAERRHRIRAFISDALEHVPELAQDIRAIAEASHVAMEKPSRSLASSCTESVDV